MCRITIVEWGGKMHVSPGEIDVDVELGVIGRQRVESIDSLKISSLSIEEFLFFLLFKRERKET